MQPDLFDQYPKGPGYTEPTTSKDAARGIAPRVRTLRERALEEIRRAGDEGISADDVAERMNKNILSIRPRVAELKALGLIEETGERSENDSGMTAHKWRLAKEHGA